MDIIQLKKMAAKAAVDYIKDGMIVGLGSGSTSAIAIDLIGEKVKKGLKIIGVPSSIASEKQAIELGIPLATLDEQPVIDITIDGADEFDPYLNLIKGGGGAHLREKVVANSSKELFIMVDERKQVDCLGKFPLPVEVIPFAYQPIFNKLATLGLNPDLRKHDEGTIFLTDQQNYIIDCHIGKIKSPYELAHTLSAIPGIVEHGLFLGMATKIFMAKGAKIVIFG